MAFRLKPHERPGKGIRRIITGEIDGALESFARAGQDEEAVVHDIRTHCKKMRAMLRLVRREIGDQAYRRENACFRDIARPLARLRDARTRVRTLGGVAGGQFPAADRGVAADYRIIRLQAAEDTQLFARLRQTLEEARLRADDWPVDGMAWKGVRRGVRRMYRKARKAFKRAERHPSDAVLHECRKQSKYLGYQMKALAPVRPEKFARRLHRFADLLGDDHDLAVLKARLRAGRAKAELISIIEQRRHVLQQKAFRLGRRLYEKSPGRFARRFRKRGA